MVIDRSLFRFDSLIRTKGVRSMAMTSQQELFLHELSDMYDAEQRISKMLPVMAKECETPQVKSAFEQHEQETLHQIQNLEQCFQTLGTKPEKASCETIVGLKKEHDTFLKEDPSAEILTMFDLGGASKTEHYEIASYKGLIDKATLMGQQPCVSLLRENLQQEEAMARKVEQLSRQIGQQLLQQTT
jgi:ferritin-like metal-binding protein YciE